MGLQGLNQIDGNVNCFESLYREAIDGYQALRAAGAAYTMKGSGR